MLGQRADGQVVHVAGGDQESSGWWCSVPGTEKRVCACSVCAQFSVHSGQAAQDHLVDLAVAAIQYAFPKVAAY